MTDSTIPSAEQLDQTEPENDTVVSRESDEGYRLRAYIVSGESVDDTEARTYGRAFGHYFVSPNSQATEDLDNFVADFMTSNSVISRFQRNRGQAYEVIIEVDDTITATEYQFTGSREAVVEIPSHSEYVESIEEVIDSIEEEITN